MTYLLIKYFPYSRRGWCYSYSNLIVLVSCVMSSGQSSRIKLMLVFVTTRYGEPALSLPWETLGIIDSRKNSSCVDGRSLLVSVSLWQFAPRLEFAIEERQRALQVRRESQVIPTQNSINVNLMNDWCVDYSAVISHILKRNKDMIRQIFTATVTQWIFGFSCLHTQCKTHNQLSFKLLLNYLSTLHWRKVHSTSHRN